MRSRQRLDTGKRNRHTRSYQPDQLTSQAEQKIKK